MPSSTTLHQQWNPHHGRGNIYGKRAIRRKRLSQARLEVAHPALRTPTIHFYTPASAKLGKAAEQECQEPDRSRNGILSKTPGDAQSRAARSLLRHEWQPNSKTAQAIEVAVAKLLSDPKQAELAEQQMEKDQS